MLSFLQVHDFEFAENLDIIVEETLPALQKVVDSGKARSAQDTQTLYKVDTSCP